MKRAKTEVHEEVRAEYKATGKVPVERWPSPEVRLPDWKAARQFKRGMVIGGPTEASTYFRQHIAGMDVECFIVLFLDNRNHALHAEAVLGTVGWTAVYPREIFKKAFELNASSIILAHNHPGGDLTPSEADRILTRNMTTAAKALGMSLQDHLIITNEDFFSFRKSGFL